MSVYNFNDHEHTVSSNIEFPRSNGNGIHQSGYQQIENDFLNRSTNHISNHNETSVQLTRPTSKTALLVRQRRAMLEQLSCSICKGYIIDATTIDECMDSFCKSCIVLYLTNHYDCPKCGTKLPHQNPYASLRSDQVLQEIVYKLIPGLFDDEMRRRRDFYKEHFGAVSASSDEDDDSSTGSLTIHGSDLHGQKYGVVTHPKPFYKPSDSIDLSIEPQTRGDNSTIYYDKKHQSIVTCFTGSLQQRDLNNDGSTFSSVDSQLFKTYLRCPARLTVLQLKKFIAAKFNICRDDTIHLLYLNESLKEEYSLIDVAYIYDWRGVEHMKLYYIIERDLSKVSVPNNTNIDGQRRVGKPHKHTVAISTQTVKRVCIDPKPKFCEENNNNIVLANSEGRSMRPRTDNSIHINKTTQVVQANSIIKSSRDCSSNTTTSDKINGYLHKDQHQSQRHVYVPNRQVTKRIVTMIDDFPARIEVKESRSLRSQVSGPVQAITSPKISSRVDNRPNGSISRQDGAHFQGSEEDIAKISQTKNVSQIEPYTGPKITTVASSTQSSLVSLASFSEARSNQVVTTMNSNSNNITTISNSQGSSRSNSSVDSAVKSVQNPKFPSTPQLAFSFVTERGITIVRRINNQDDFKNSHSSTMSNGSAQHRISVPSTMHMNIAPQIVQSSSQEVQQSSSSRRSLEDGASSRHQIKIKPVYKTFVDPTKLKSPNHKKLGFTARH